MSATSRSLGRWKLHGISITSFYDLRESHSHPLPPQEIPQRWAGRSCPGSYKVTAFALGLGEHETLCVPSKNGVSLSQSLVELLQSSPAALQSQMLWGPPPITRTSTWAGRLGVVCAEAENSHYCERVSVNCSLVCGSPTQVGFDYIASVLSYCLVGFLHYAFGCRISSLLKWSVSCSVMSDSLQPHSPPGSSVHGIFQARTVKWVVISSSRRPSWPRD